MHTVGCQLVRLANGTHTVYSSDYGEKMHPGLGPAAEGDLLYVRQLKIAERMRTREGEFVVWDVGLGAAANVVTVLRATRDIARPLRLVSFDNTSGPLEFALSKAEQLGYFHGYETYVAELLKVGTARCAVRTPQRGVPTESPAVTFQNERSRVTWEFHLDDFPALIESRAGVPPAHTKSPCGGSRRDACPTLPAPHAILFDAFSPAKNPAMWTLPLFTNLFRRLDPARPCNLTTYSRSTMLRVTLLLAGFFVGRGIPTGLKEETTVAANTLALLAEPLDRRWLERARRSDSAEPLHEPAYRRAPLSSSSWEELQRQPQFEQ
jgi:hypothetical protein